MGDRVAFVVSQVSIRPVDLVLREGRKRTEMQTEKRFNDSKSCETY